MKRATVRSPFLWLCPGRLFKQSVAALFMPQRIQQIKRAHTLPQRGVLTGVALTGAEPPLRNGRNGRPVAPKDSKRSYRRRVV
jgi:hypothetical protein